MNFLQFLNALSSSSAEFIIVGGVAARLYGSTRLTHDIDVVPKLSQDSWPQLIEKIWELGGRPRIPESKEHIQDVQQIRNWIKEKGMLALSFRSDDGTAEIDLLVAKSPEFDDLKANARKVSLDGQEYWIAGIDDLIRMKEAAGRPQDLLDIEELRAIRSRLTDDQDGSIQR